MGGAQKFLYELVTHLNSEKYDILVAAGNPTEKSEELFSKLGVKKIKTVKIRNFSNTPGVKNLLAFFEILRLIFKTKPDIVYLLSSEAGFSGSIAGSLYRLSRKRVKIIYRIGGWAFKEPRNIFIKNIYLLAEKISAPFKDIVIVNSEFDRQIAIRNKIVDSEKIVTIYNGVDLNEIKFIPKEIAKKFIESKLPIINQQLPTTIMIGTIANLYKNKGLEYLIPAIEKIRYNNKLCLTIIGDGPERKNIEKLIKKYKLENQVFLIGKIRDAHKYLKAFDLFVLPSVKEGQPWAILEAMAAELPIVATNIAGIPEMIKNEESGLLVEPADPIILATAVEKILTHQSLAIRCVKNALETVKEKFEIDNMIRKNEELFQ